MISFFIVAVSALSVSALTLYSGFGLGTLLMPVFAVFFPVEMAVAATAIVHGANNIFKIAVVGRHADRSLVIKFGVPAIGASMVGAAVLGYVSGFGNLATYAIGPKTAVITPVKLVMAALMFVFALFELVPSLRDLRFDRKYLFLGGALSGFFGGVSGHQGALRSAFLVKVGVSTEAFVGTNAVIGFMVDMARIMVYGFIFFLTPAAKVLEAGNWLLVVIGIVAAFIGVMAGKRFLHKITMQTVQALTGILLIGIAVALGAGIL